MPYIYATVTDRYSIYVEDDDLPPIEDRERHRCKIEIRKLIDSMIDEGNANLSTRDIEFTIGD